MIALYIDTSSSYLYSALIKEDKIITEIKKDFGQQLSTEALPQIIKMFQKSDISPQDIDRIYIVTGPGSFTGIRIGVTIAKTYAWALEKEIIPVSALTAMALSYQGEKEYIMPVLDARRGYVFGAVYDKNGNPIIEDKYIALKELEKQAKNLPLIIVTNNELDTEIEICGYQPNILKIIEQYKSKEPVNPHLINPIYLKKTEAEEKKENDSRTNKE